MKVIERPGQIDAVQKIENGIQLKADVGLIEIRILQSNLMRVSWLRDGKVLMKSPAIVARDTNQVSYEIIENAEEVCIETELLRMRIDKKPLKIVIEDQAGDLLLADWEDHGFEVLKDGQVRSKKVLQSECFYGLGERTGFLDKRGEEHELWNFDQFGPHIQSTQHMYKAIPFFIGLKDKKAYGLFFDNTFKSRFNFGAKDEQYYSFEADGGTIDYYFIYGPEMKGVVQDFTRLTGHLDFPPIWSLGFQQSRFSYFPEERVEQLAATFREKEIPCDVLYLDIDYMDGFRVFTWDSKRFPRPEKMLAKLAQNGYKVINITDPGVKVDPDYSCYQELMEQDFACKKPGGEDFVGEVWPGKSVFPDFSEQAVRQWWGQKNVDFLKNGIAGIWNDMNEPSVFDGEGKTMDLDVIHTNDGNPVTHKEYHNLYGMMMTRATREGLKKADPDTRYFVLSRAAYAGIQRYAAVWTGDNYSSWHNLAMSIPMLCNLSLSGASFCGADIGGFKGDASPELFARWMELGVFYPYCRAHSNDNTKPHEPWAFGPEVEAICKDHIQMRYRLLPYLYTAFKQHEETGEPIFRPLVFDYQTDPRVLNLNDQFLWGRDLMVAPVIQPGVNHRAVYLPQGSWYDYYTGEKYQGNQWILADAPLERIPVYVRAGSVVPHAPVHDYIDPTVDDPIRFQVYPGSGQSIYYEDDGVSYQYRSGEYNRYLFQQWLLPTGMEMTIDPNHLGYEEKLGEFWLEFIGCEDEVELVMDGAKHKLAVNQGIARFKMERPETSVTIKVNF